MRNTETVSARQLTVFASVAALSAGIREIAGMASAGRAGILANIAALPAGLLIMSMLGALYKKYPETGLDGIFIRSLGRFFGGFALLLAGAVIPLAIAALTARTHSELFSSTIFPGARPYYFLIPAAAAVFFITRRGLDGAARLATALALILSAALATVFFASIGNIKGLLPLYTDDMRAFARAASYGTAVPAFIVTGNLLSGSVINRRSLRREGIWASAVMCAGLTLITAVCVGVLGAGLASRSMSPIFTAAKALTVPGIFERIDALTVVVWIAADITLLALSGFVFSRAVGAVFRARDSAVFAAPFAFLTAGAAFALSGDEFAALKAEAPLLGLCSAAALGVFVTVFAFGMLRRT